VPEPAETKLRDGSTIFIRQVRDDDKSAIAAGFERLSPESRYRRFFSGISRLSDSDLRYLTEVDHSAHEAMIAFDTEGGPVGVARYVKVADAEAEVAVAVVDDWQGRGAATALLDRLVERALQNGIERFLATVLSENEDALELFRSISPDDPAPRRTTAGQLELIIELPRDGVQGTLLGRALRSAASGALEIHPWRLIRARLAALGDLRHRGDTRPHR
jgi:GNAT superfamily N-acetyltransferase